VKAPLHSNPPIPKLDWCMYHEDGECDCRAYLVVLGCIDLEMEGAIEEEIMKEFLDWVEGRLATHEGGAGNISIGWDDATRDYIISQRKIFSYDYKVLGCSRSLGRAIELAISGKVFD
jgi:hypothetical protein